MGAPYASQQTASATSRSACVQYRALHIAQLQSGEQEQCNSLWAPGSSYLPAPDHQQTLRGGDAIWRWSLSDAGVSQHDVTGTTLLTRKHDHPTAHERAGRMAPTALASITTSLLRDHRRLSAHLDQWARWLGQRSSGQEAATSPERQSKRQTQRRKRAEQHTRSCKEQEAQRPVRPARFAAIGGGGTGGIPEPAAGGVQHGSELSAPAAGGAGNGVPTRYAAHRDDERLRVSVFQLISLLCNHIGTTES